MMSQDYQDYIDLAHLDQDFADAKPEDREYEDVPDGKYQVNVEAVEMKLSREKKTPMLSWQFKIIAPKYAGRMLFKNSVIVTAENAKWLKGDLATCGMDVDNMKLSSLESRLGELLDVRLEVQVVTKGEYTNVYLNRKIVMSDGTVPAEYEAQLQKDDSERPF